VFSSLQFFNIIRQPLATFPLVLTACSDALVALGRIGKFLAAEELREPYAVDRGAKWAVDVDASFAWEVTARALAAKFDTGRGRGRGRGGRGGRGGAAGGERAAAAGKGPGRFAFLKRKADADKNKDKAADKDKAASAKTEDKGKAPQEQPFALERLRLQIARGAFVAIVGRIGSGKSSILNALIGEMRRTGGRQVVFGGSVAYAPQVRGCGFEELAPGTEMRADAVDHERYPPVRICTSGRNQQAD
jgi:ATP-binding cassette subfamily C (CFTR/MRP) protein 1